MGWTPRCNQKHTVCFLSMSTKCAVCFLNNVSHLEDSLQDCSQPDISFPLVANSAAAIVATSIPPPTPVCAWALCLLPWAISILRKKWEKFSKIIKIFRKQVGILVCCVTSQLNHKFTPPIYLYIDLFIYFFSSPSSFSGQLSWCICFMYYQL